MKILMVAADRMEFPGILAHTTGATAATLPLDWARQAQLGANQVLLAANGAGARRAAAAVDAAIPSFQPDAIVSIGFCGALAPELSLADIVCGTTVTNGPTRFTSLQPQHAPPHHKGVIMSIDHVAQTAAEKRSLREGGGGIAVEMESAAVAARAEEYRIPFYCVRVVTDLAGEDMANDFNGVLREDGHFATMNILKGTLRKPWVRIPELFRLRKRCARAARVLGDFIADCRF